MYTHTSSAPVRSRSRGLRALGIAVVTLALCLGTVTAPAPAQAAPADIDRIVTDTNVARVAQGLSALAHNSGLDAVAQAWAQRMATTGFAHNPDYSTQIPAGWTRASENIAAGYTAATVVTAWLNSPGHRTNIMAAVTDIGVGFYAAPGGTTYLVQNFAAYAPGTLGAAMRIVTPTPTPTPTMTPTPSPQPSVLTATPVPRVSGSALLGRTLTVSTGSWAPTPLTVALQWKRSGVTIPGATAGSYSPVATDLGKVLTVTATGSRAGYATVAQTSVGTAPVRGTLTATPTPTISGTAVAGRTLTAVTGSWAPAPVSLAYQWTRGGSAIAGATGPGYLVGSADAGTQLAVTVTGSRTDYVPVARRSVSVFVTAG